MPTIEVRFSQGLHLGRLLSNIRPSFMTGTNILVNPKGRPNVCFQKYHERLKKLVRDKHSSLLGRRVSDEEKKVLYRRLLFVCACYGERRKAT
jgi:hypothetical protein